MLYKVTVRSKIDYALPIYYHILKASEKKHLKQVQYKAARLVTGTQYSTSQVKLNTELGWELKQERIS